MNAMKDGILLNNQYKTDESLRLRIAFHQKYSLQKEPFSQWLFAHYKFFPGMRILEIGCGNGSLWQGRLHLLPAPSLLLLTDLSPGMVAAAEKALEAAPFLSFQTADIQALPFPDDSFDMVIANMMLYHVPDLEGALAQVRRVLKTGGCFHCATSGEKTAVDYIRALLQHDAPPHLSFTLQNGERLLRPFFETVTASVRQDALLVTNLDDMMAYIHSLPCMAGLQEADKITLRRLLESKMEGGVLSIPKEYGTFCCRK